MGYLLSGFNNASTLINGSPKDLSYDTKYALILCRNYTKPKETLYKDLFFLKTE